MINGALTVVLVFLALLLGGLIGGWAVWPTAERHGYAEGVSDRNRHRKGDPLPAGLVELPMSGRLAVEPDPDDWRFAGGWDQGWKSGAAEYELLTRAIGEATEAPTIGSLDWTARKVAEVAGADRETDSGFTRRMARETTEFIAKMDAETNYAIFTMRAD